jgi:GTPase SAR1 family protein
MAKSKTPDKAEPQQVQTLVLPKNFEISPEMQAAITAVSNGKSLFITGRAGTGKSTLLTYLREEVLHDNYVVVAPTGVAAINVGGSTIHKFFGFLPDITFQHIESAEYHPRNQKIMKNLKTLIIDEISMVRADLLDCVEMALRKFGPKPTKPFGGGASYFRWRPISALADCGRDRERVSLLALRDSLFLFQQWVSQHSNAQSCS